MAHEVRGISPDFYEATPSRIYEMYMHYMGNVEFVPEDCKKKLDEIEL